MASVPELVEGEIVGRGDVRSVVYGNDAGLYVEFRNESVLQTYASEAEGKPVYKTVPFIKIYTPGAKNIVDRPVRMESWGDVPSDPQRFYRQWEAFQKGQAPVVDGTPLAEWPQVMAQQVRELQAMSIYTVEALASIPDSNLDRLGHGGRALRDKASLWVKARDDGAPLMAMQAEIDRLRQELAAQSAPRRGRPPKQEEDEVNGE